MRRLHIRHTMIHRHPAAATPSPAGAASASVALATFSREATVVRVVSEILLRRDGSSPPADALGRGVAAEPVLAEVCSLTSAQPREPVPPEHLVQAWANRFVRPSRTAIEVVIAMAKAIHQELAYDRDERAWPRSPIETLDQGRGACRDLALLLAEASRSLGLRARFVSGDPLDPPGRGVVGSEAYGWAQVYVP